MSDEPVTRAPRETDALIEWQEAPVKPRWQRRIQNVAAAIIILALSFGAAAVILALCWRFAAWVLT